MSGRPPRRVVTVQDRAPVKGLWSHVDEALVRSGIYRFAKTDDQDTIRRTAERRRMSVRQFLQTVPIEFGGTQPLEPEPER